MKGLFILAWEKLIAWCESVLNEPEERTDPPHSYAERWGKPVKCNEAAEAKWRQRDAECVARRERIERERDEALRAAVRRLTGPTS